MKKLIDYLKEKFKSDSEIFSVKSKIDKIIFKGNKLNSIENDSIEGYGIRIINDGKLGFISTNCVKSDNIKYLAEKAVEISGFGEVAHFSFPEKCNIIDLRTHDKNLEQKKIEYFINLGKNIIKELLRFDKSLFMDLNLTRSITETTLQNSSGFEHSFEATRTGIDVSTTKVAGNGILLLIDFITSCSLPEKTQFEVMVEGIKTNLKNSSRIVDVKKGDYRMLFTPKAVSLLIDILLAGFNGKIVSKNMSFLTDKLGKKVFSDCLELSDNPHLDFGYKSSAVDGEGIETGKLKLVEKGKVSNFIYDLQTAGMKGVKSTGSGQRGYSSPPSPGFSNVVIGTGDRNYNELVGELKDGIIVDQIIGAGQSNILAGEYSVNVNLGFLVDNGKIIGRVKDCMTAGNVYQLFNNIIETGNDRTGIGNIYTPSILFHSCSLV